MRVPADAGADHATVSDPSPGVTVSSLTSDGDRSSRIECVTVVPSAAVTTTTGARPIPAGRPSSFDAVPLATVSPGRMAEAATVSVAPASLAVAVIRTPAAADDTVPTRTNLATS